MNNPAKTNVQRIPSHSIAASHSGIVTARDIERLLEAGNCGMSVLAGNFGFRGKQFVSTVEKVRSASNQMSHW